MPKLPHRNSEDAANPRVGGEHRADPPPVADFIQDGTWAENTPVSVDNPLVALIPLDEDTSRKVSVTLAVEAVIALVARTHPRPRSTRIQAVLDAAESLHQTLSATHSISAVSEQVGKFYLRVALFPVVAQPAQLAVLEESVSDIMLAASHEAVAEPADGTVDVRLYVDDHSNVVEVESALAEVLAAYGFKVTRSGLPALGSWYRRVRAKVPKASGHKAAKHLALELERAIQLRAVEEVQARVDAAKGDAVAKLLTSLENNSNALIQIGSMLIIKIDGVPLVRTLTSIELAYLNRNPELSKNPAVALRVLQQVADDAERTAHDNRQLSQKHLVE